MDAVIFQRAAGVSADLACKLIPYVNTAFMEFKIVELVHQAAWIAECGHESMGFTRAREIWGPTPAQLRYEGRKDLGNTQPGDGKRFMGRGWIQITGRAGYIEAGKALGVDLVAHPYLLEDIDLAAASAAWWWNVHGCSSLLDAKGFDAVTQRINGGQNGAAERRQRWEMAKQALGVLK